MRYPNLVAFEHDSLPGFGDGGQATLSADEVDRLALIGEARPGFCERGLNSVRLSQYCGVVSTGRRTLEILPKTLSNADVVQSRGLMLRLLSTCTSLPIARQLEAMHSLDAAPLLDVFIAAFLDAIAHIGRGGLLRLYREHEADLLVVRGKVMLNRQITTLMDRRDMVACRYDELTTDNVWNRLLKSALIEVRSHIQRAELQRRWIELFALFDEVSPTEVSSRSFDRLVFDRHATRYKTAIEWARWIVGTLSPQIAAGEKPAPGLLFDMNVLFQDYIAAKMLRGAQRRPGLALEAQDRVHFLAHEASTGTPAFSLRPDLVVSKHGRAVAVADTKWKRVERTVNGYIRPTESDMYQMLAYASRYACDHLALIYPWHAGLAGARETAFKLPATDGREPVVHVICIELGKTGDRVRLGEQVPVVGNLMCSEDDLVAAA